MPFVAVNPTTGETIATYPAHTREQVNLALATAHAAFLEWRTTSFEERAVLMVRAAELLEGELPVVAQLLTSEMGKTFAAAKGEVAGKPLGHPEALGPTPQPAHPARWN